MKNLLAKVAAPFVVMAALGGQPAVAENRSNFNFGLGVFTPANKEVKDRYSDTLFGGRIGVESRISEYFNFSTNLSAFTAQGEDGDINYAITFFQLEPMINVVSPEDKNGTMHLGAGLSYTSVQENASRGSEEAEGSADALGIVVEAGIETVPKNDWSFLINLSYRLVNKDDAKFGGSALTLGGKYHFGK